MAKEFDTSWFDLKNYEPFKSMSVETWIWQLEARGYYHLLVRNKLMRQDEVDKTLFFIATKLKKGVIPDDPNYPTDIHDRRVEALLEGPPFSTASVKSLDSYDLWRMVKDTSINHIWDACKHVDDFFWEDNLNQDLFDIANRPHDLNHKKLLIDYKKEAHVVIDLTATDEQIKNDFNQWLTGFRKEINYPRQKKLFTQADFDYWIEFGLIPYLDLTLIAKIEGKKITQNKLARLIFPDEYEIDIVERLRKVTRPLAEWLINSEIQTTLSVQLAYEKSGKKKA